MERWVALGEIVLANLVWISELDLEGWMLATALAVGAGVAVWLLVGTVWLVVGASLYLALLVGVKLLADPGRRADERRARAR